jgi:hypothetical protein
MVGIDAIGHDGRPGPRPRVRMNRQQNPSLSLFIS